MKASVSTSLRTTLILMVVLSAMWPSGLARAEYVVEIPALAAMGDSPDDQGAFTVKLLWWDQKNKPKPVTLKWGSANINSWQYGHISPGAISQETTQWAFRYAIEHTPTIKHTGTVGIQSVAYLSTRMDGPSAGAIMAVGFIALFKGDSLQRGVALTGTLEPGGGIGAVGGLPGKIRAAAREGYHTILIPAGQLSDPSWDLKALALELNVTIREVRTLDEAYTLLTGRRI